MTHAKRHEILLIAHSLGGLGWPSGIGEEIMKIFGRFKLKRHHTQCLYHIRYVLCK